MRIRLLLCVLAVVVAGCPASSPRKLTKAGAETVYQFIERTGRLCTGVAPVLSKAECLDRIAIAERAQDALDAATVAVAMCPADTACPDADYKLAAAAAVLRQLETYVYRGQ